MWPFRKKDSPLVQARKKFEEDCKLAMPELDRATREAWSKYPTDYALMASSWRDFKAKIDPSLKMWEGLILDGYREARTRLSNKE